jgi:hypothetical protein
VSIDRSDAIRAGTNLTMRPENFHLLSNSVEQSLVSGPSFTKVWSTSDSDRWNFWLKVEENMAPDVLSG